MSSTPAHPAAAAGTDQPDAQQLKGARLMDGVPTANSPAEALDQVLDVLDLHPQPDTGPDHFVGSSYRTPWGRVFGGQVLAQSVVAALRTIDEDRPVHSLHAYFLRPGDPEIPIEFSVERLRDGRSFSARRTHALQLGKPILSMITSFQAPADGLDHQVPMPQVVPPEELPNLDDLFGHIKAPELQQMLRSRPVDVRHVESPIYVTAGAEQVGHQAVWIRAAGPMPADLSVHTALLAFVSDYTLLESIMRRHGLSWATRGMRTASLDHAMWFHRQARFDDWVLYVQESPSASGARGLCTGRLYSRDGVLMASVAQEGMMRVPAESR